MNLLELSEDFQQCREYRHPWVDYDVEETGYDIKHIQKCPRCGNERFRILSKRKASYGHVVRRWQIRYTAHDYLLKKEDRPTADDWGAMRMSLIAPLMGTKK